MLGARHRLWQGGEDLPSGAVVLATKLPTASTASGLSSGETDLRAALVLNQSVGPVGLNAFYQYGALGDPAGAGTVSEHTGTLTASVALTDRWSALAELAGVVVPAQDLESWFVITGVAWAAEPWLVLDAGVTVGLSDDAPDLQVFVGFTQNFGGPARGDDAARGSCAQKSAETRSVNTHASSTPARPPGSWIHCTSGCTRSHDKSRAE